MHLSHKISLDNIWFVHRFPTSTYTRIERWPYLFKLFKLDAASFAHVYAKLKIQDFVTHLQRDEGKIRSWKNSGFQLKMLPLVWRGRGMGGTIVNFRESSYASLLFENGTILSTTTSLPLQPYIKKRQQQPISMSKIHLHFLACYIQWGSYFCF